ncbi:hypothetical protein D9M69_578570 [compost metagenome]
MDVFDKIARIENAGADALLLDVHVIGVEVDEDVIGADPLDHVDCLPAGVDQVVLVPVDRLDAQLDAARLRMLGGCPQCASDVVVFGLSRRHAGTLADAAIDDA